MKSKRLRNLLRFGCAVRWTGPADGLADTGRVVCEGRGGLAILIRWDCGHYTAIPRGDEDFLGYMAARIKIVT
jgi:hypothetical protein